jgi:hypothetical protein
MSKLLVFLGAFLSISASAFAQSPAEQIKKLQDNPNVAWVSEIYVDYEDLHGFYEGRNVDRAKLQTLADGNKLTYFKQTTRLMKLAATADAPVFWEDFFTNQVIAPQVEKYADADLSRKLTTAEADGIVNQLVRLTTYAERGITPTITLAVNPFDPTTVAAYRLRMLVYYDKKAEFLFTQPISIGLVVKQKNEETGELIGLKTLFWLPVKAQTSLLSAANTPNMPMIKSVQLDALFTDFKPLKESISRDSAFTHFTASLRKNLDKIFAVNITNDSHHTGEVFTPAQLKKMFEGTKISTLVDINGKTVENENNNWLASEKIIGLRFNNFIGWDSQQRAFVVSPYSLTYLVRNFDANNQMLYFGPAFYLYPHKRYKK